MDDISPFLFMEHNGSSYSTILFVIYAVIHTELLPIETIQNISITYVQKNPFKQLETLVGVNFFHNTTPTNTIKNFPTLMNRFFFSTICVKRFDKDKTKF
jgi:hypothetical protein